ncbi:M28 family peptidase [Croceitalea rosinachiae]|uniref:M28 family peptidase n=1 Tax=Croceitalea rosinachiae TaxID=3075596 RepID=A0ABU3ABI6_9FLAO|nr:M28 family peptidase [Croceitalea sp. F388]MDT0607349.1 M28 family peptidase [Croceitalea sp. F388]
MNKILVLIFGFAISCNSSQKTIVEKNEPKPTQDFSRVYAATITEDELKEHLYIYASDEFEGRETGKPGQKKAVDYLKTEYEALGIQAAKANGDYFQKVPIEISKVPQGTLDTNGKAFAVGEDILTFSSAIGTYKNIVYVGYGIEEENYSDYANIDVEGKLVLIKSGEPKNEDGTYKVSGSTKKSIWSNMSEAPGKRFELATQKGAKGILYYDSQNYARYNRYFEFMKTNNSGRMELKAEYSNQFNILLNKKAAMSILPTIESDEGSKNLDVTVKLDIESGNTQIDSENVAAIIRGTTKPDEYLIISSHLDHIGVTSDGQINNGADDDGSGTVALLEIAEAFKKAADEGKGPKRSVIFLHVTGEEKGLLGSKYYTDYQPIVPLSNTTANLNIDMIGRIDPKRTGDRNYIYLIGSDKLSTELHQLSEEINTIYTNIELDYTYNDENDPNRFYYRSDHYNFAKNNIPIIFYFNGTHEDYHRPGDTPDKINYDLLKNRAQLVFHTAWEVANRPNKILVDKPIITK